MKLKTSKLTGKPLDYAVAKALGDVDRFRTGGFHPSICWNQGGPIIERESLWVRESAVASPAVAHLIPPERKWFSYATQDSKGHASAPYYGETYLISAMRCFVASKLGDEVEIPEELL